MQQHPFSAGEITPASPQSSTAPQTAPVRGTGFSSPLMESVKCFCNTAPFSENFPAHTSLHTPPGWGRTTEMLPQATWSPAGLSQTTDGALRRLLAGEGIEDGLPALSQQAKHSARKQFCLTDLDMPARSRGKTRLQLFTMGGGVLKAGAHLMLKS